MWRFKKLVFLLVLGMMGCGESRTSDKNEPRFIQVLSPNGGERWEAGRNYTATWKSSSDISVVKVSVSCENYWYGPWDAESSQKENSFTFNIISSSPSQSQCKVFVDDVSITNISQREAGINSDSSDGNLSIMPHL